MVTEAEPEQSPFNVVMHDQGITVWVNSGHDAESSTKTVTWCRAGTSGRRGRSLSCVDRQVMSQTTRAAAPWARLVTAARGRSHLRAGHCEAVEAGASNVPARSRNAM